MANNSVTSIGSINSLMLEQIRDITGTQHDLYAAVCDRMFTKIKSDRFQEEFVEMVSLGLMVRKEEFSGSVASALSENYKTQIPMYDWTISHTITDRAMRFNKMTKLILNSAQHLARSSRHTDEFQAADLIDRARDATQLGGDGKSLTATDHPLGVSGTFSNLSSSAVLTQGALETMLTDIKGRLDPAGLPMMTRIKGLVVPSELFFTANEILKSRQELDSENNNINSIQYDGLIPGGIIENNYLQNAAAYHILTECDNGLLHIEGMPFETTTDVDKSTRGITIYGFKANTFYWHDPRSIQGNAGT